MICMRADRHLLKVYFLRLNYSIFYAYNTYVNFNIWVDADSVPVKLRQMILKAATRTSARCFFVADRELPDVKAYIAEDTFSLREKARQNGQTDAVEIRRIRSQISMVVVSSGENSADDYIVEQASPESLCITHDIPLASRLLEKGCTVIDDRGAEYTQDDIRARLGDRLVNQELRSWGVFSEQQAKMGQGVQKAFADNLDRTITRMTR